MQTKRKKGSNQKCCQLGRVKTQTNLRARTFVSAVYRPTCVGDGATRSVGEGCLVTACQWRESVKCSQVFQSSHVEVNSNRIFIGRMGQLSDECI